MNMSRERDKVLAALETIIEKTGDADLEVLATAIQTWKDTYHRSRVSPFLDQVFEVVGDEHGFRKAMEEMGDNEQRRRSDTCECGRINCSFPECSAKPVSTL
jgi:hypothetical protein